MGNDLGYKSSDRDKNAKRLIKFIKFLSSQKINVICAANLTKKNINYTLGKFWVNNIMKFL